MRNTILIVLTTLLILFASASLAQYKPGDAITPSDHPSVKNPAMKFGLLNKQGKFFAKDPTVIRFKGKYWMYFSFTPRDPQKKSRYYIGVATSDDLTSWTHVGDVTPLPGSGHKDIAAPCAKVWDGKVHLFYQKSMQLERKCLAYQQMQMKTLQKIIL